MVVLLCTRILILEDTVDLFLLFVVGCAAVAVAVAVVIIVIQIVVVVFGYVMTPVCVCMYVPRRKAREPRPQTPHANQSHEKIDRQIDKIV